MYFENIPQKLKLNYIWEYMISEMIYNRNTSYAYVIREGKFNILFSNDDDIWHVIERFGKLFTNIKRRISKALNTFVGFEYLSYKLRLFSPLEDRMNTVVQRCVDHGIIKYLVAKNKRLLTGIRPKDKGVVSTIAKPISVGDMKEPFSLFALGIALSTITLIVERIYYGRKRSIEQKRNE